MWTLQTPWYELVLRGTVTYFFMFILMRIWGRKHLAEVTTFDFILLLFISEAIQNSLVDDDSSLFGGMIVIVTFLFWSTLLNKLSFRFKKVEEAVDGRPKVIIKDGVIQEKVRKKEELTQQEIQSALRENGIEDVKKVKQATIEPNGHITVIQYQ